MLIAENIYLCLVLIGDTQICRNGFLHGGWVGEIFMYGFLSKIFFLPLQL